ncbi:glycosyltransferase family 2 protein [Polaribacter atrinae]|uniref:Glycosyltransferase 2-like domain-containing protein n=1 Tax=Polaribacter atrinae TaxID=1333662 RepID=A0A176TBG1_9FLAO|nr:glycosyltransferase family 2 protein [Polaribacter atrinae]OAD44746.1 hypothetical protein LPB303_11355 [Polaribacter atrinae]
MSIKNELTIILPIYNPQIGWEKLLNIKLDELNEVFKNVDFKTIIVNDGSSKNLITEIDALKKNYKNLEFITYINNKGKGFAVKEGFKNANSTYYIYTDWDFPFNIESLYKSYELLKTKTADVIIGTRTSNYYKRLPLFRKLISIGLRVLNFILFGFKNIDTQAGLKGVNEKGKLHFIETKTNSFIFEFEFIKRILKQNLKISLREDIVFTNFSFKTLKKELYNLFKMYFNN